MKYIKYILIVLIAIPLLVIAPAVVGILGGGTFLGILILGGLDSLGVIKIKGGTTNEFLIYSTIVGVVLILFYIIIIK